MQRQDKAGDWAVVLPPGTVYTPLTITSARAKQAAAVFDYNLGSGQVAGFVASLSSKASDVAHDTSSATKLLSTRFPDNVTDKVNAGTEAVQLNHTPISASLRLAKNWVSVQRSLLNGFKNLRAKNSLVFYGTFSWPTGSTLTVTYSRWK